MAYFGRRDVTYSALSNEITPPLGGLADNVNITSPKGSVDADHEDYSKVIIHEVPKTKGKPH